MRDKITNLDYEKTDSLYIVLCDFVPCDGIMQCDADGDDQV